MTALDFLFKSIERRDIDSMDWYFSVFGYTGVGTNPYIKIENMKAYSIKDNNEEITDYEGKGSVLVDDMIVIAKKGLFSIVKDDTETTVSILLCNYLLLESVYGNLIPWQETIDVRKIENDYIAPGMADNVLTSDQLNLFVDNVNFIKALAILFVSSATNKSLVPPKGIYEYRDKVIAELEKKYGKDWFKDAAYLAEYDKRLKEFDKEWFKGDDFDEVMYRGKIAKITRPESFLSIGGVFNAFDPEDDAVFIKQSIYEGIPREAKAILARFNDSRAGSYSRGSETQFGGVTADAIIRVLSNLIIPPDSDCKVKKGKKYLITKKNMISMRNRYKVSNGALVTEADIGKYVEVRSPSECKLKGNHRCAICSGRILGDKKNGSTFLGLLISNVIMNVAMKNMHGTERKTTRLDINKVIS